MTATALRPIPPQIELLASAHEFVHVGTWMWDVSANRVHWSDELFRLFGLEPGSIALDFGAFISRVHADDRELMERTVRQALETKSAFAQDHRIVTASGAIRVVHGRGSVICDRAGVVTQMLGTSMDVTDQAAQVKALTLSEERFRSVFEQSAVGMVIADADKRMIRVNDAFARLLGCASTQLLGRTVIEITHPDDVGLTQERFKQHQELRDSFTYEKRYLHRNGYAVWARVTVTPLYDPAGTLSGYTGVIEDVSGRKRDRERLKRQAEMTQSMLDHLPVMVSLFDTEGTPLYVNKEWSRTFGWTLEELAGFNVLHAVYPDHVDRERVAECFTRGSGEWSDFSPKLRDGRVMDSSWACIKVSDGRRLAIGQDMTQRRRLEQQLLQAQKMEAIGQLAGGVAHDFNNLLTVISACATFVQEAVSDEQVLADVKEIQNASKRAESLTRQLLAFSRRQMLHPEIVDVNMTLQTLMKTLQRLINENIELELVTRAKKAMVEVDTHQLEQVLLNLVVNARDAVGDNGLITIETSIVKPHPDDLEGRDYIAISVSDNGCGIPEEIRQRIFEPFFTTKGVGKGTGLGLATVQGIVAQSNGRIEVESEIGKGTTFRVLLPMSANGSETVVGQFEDSSAVGGSETILLVEDEARVRAVARRILTELGYTVLEARHGADALRVSASHPDTIDVLVTDVVMPEMGGRELAKQLRGLRPGIPVLYLSGYTDDELLRKGILEPGALLLRKPFTAIELARVVRELIACVECRQPSSA
jgi:two-component system cell cycle sensor histidine kinase/response regulator CckA